MQDLHHGAGRTGVDGRIASIRPQKLGPTLPGFNLPVSPGRRPKGLSGTEAVHGTGHGCSTAGPAGCAVQRADPPSSFGRSPKAATRLKQRIPTTMNNTAPTHMEG